MSALDAALTLWGLNLQVIQEANPVMRMLIASHPGVFLLLKLTIPIALGFYCWWKRDSDRKLVSYALRIAVGMYTVVSMFHLYWVVMYETSLAIMR
ncbi:MAG: DUF5658 family protein [Peptococcaceae bacterium]|nr:DUF5658 family protein [Peptococcaceae bacterium]